MAPEERIIWQFSIHPLRFSQHRSPESQSVSLYGELKRRNVLRVAAVYIVTAWLIVQVVETLLPIYGMPDAAVRLVVNLLAIGLVPALVLAWVFEWTPEGLIKDEYRDHQRPASLKAAKQVDRIILVVLAVALGYFTLDKFVFDPARDEEEMAAAVDEAREKGRTEANERVRDTSIAVLAFQDLSPDGNQAYFGEGLAVDLINQLGKVPQLRVTGKTSAFSFQGKDSTVREIGEALNVGYVLDGSISKIGDRVRISVELVDARDDRQLWSRTYDRTLDDIFAIRDEITLRIYDRLTIEFERLMQESMRTDPRAYDLTLQARHIYAHGGEDDIKQAAEILAQALAIDADYVPALLLSVYVNDRLSQDGVISDAEAERLIDERIARVLAIDASNGEALGLFAWGDWGGQSRPRIGGEALLRCAEDGARRPGADTSCWNFRAFGRSTRGIDRTTRAVCCRGPCELALRFSIGTIIPLGKSIGRCIAGSPQVGSPDRRKEVLVLRGPDPASAGRTRGSVGGTRVDLLWTGPSPVTGRSRHDHARSRPTRGVRISARQDRCGIE